MRSEAQAVAWRAYWPVTLLAVTFLLVVSLFGTYLTARQQAADRRTEKQRKAICAILANIPGHIPAEIATARTVFARPGHPNDCVPIVKRKRPKATPTPTPGLTPAPTSTVVIVQPAPMPTPATTRSATPRPTPTRTRSARPSPSPSPSRTCVSVICVP